MVSRATRMTETRQLKRAWNLRPPPEDLEMFRGSNDCGQGEERCVSIPNYDGRTIPPFRWVVARMIRKETLRWTGNSIEGTTSCVP